MSDSTVILPAANLPREARAMLIAIAQGESDPVARRQGISPYFILYGGGSFEAMPDRSGYSGFPAWAGKDNSHAAGRYQFEPKTWLGTVPKFRGGQVNFRNPGDQDWGAWILAQADYHARTGATLLARLQIGVLDGIGSALRPTWTSMGDSTFPDRYKAALAAVPATEPTPAPAPAPEPAPTPEPTPPPAAVDLDNALMDTLIRALQINLALEGLYTGEIDGAPSAALYTAMADYWRQRGLPK